MSPRSRFSRVPALPALAFPGALILSGWLPTQIAEK